MFFLSLESKLHEKGWNGRIPLSPHNEKVDLVVFGGGASFYFPIKAESKPVHSQKEGSHDGPRSCFCNYFWWSNTRYRHAWPGLDSIFLDGVGLSFLICFNINDYSMRLDHQRIAAAMVQNPTQPTNYPWKQPLKPPNPYRKDQNHSFKI